MICLDILKVALHTAYLPYLLSLTYFSLFAHFSKLSSPYLITREINRMSEVLEPRRKPFIPFEQRWDPMDESSKGKEAEAHWRKALLSL